MTRASFSLETGDYGAAETFFTRALAIKPGDTAASTGLGMAYSGAGNYQKAKEILLKALKTDPADARVRYELGIVMYKLGEPEEARDFFTAVVDSRADETLKQGARNYLSLIAGKGGGEKQRLTLGVSGGVQYDTNVVLQPENPVAAVPQRKSDLRGIVTFDGAYRFVKSEKSFLDAGYEFYQSLHRSLTDFNVQQHGLKLSAGYDLSPTAKFGLKYTYGYTQVGGHHFSNSNETVPSFTKAFTPGSTTEFHVIYRTEQFANTDLFPTNAQLSSADMTGGIVHTVRAGAASTVSVAYDYDTNDARDNAWSYQGNRGSIGFRSTISGYTLSLSASYYDQRYQDVLPGYTAKRHDGAQEYSADLGRSVAKHLGLTLSELYTVHDSNLPAFSYTRNIVGFFVVAHL